MNERALQRQIRLALGELPGVVLWRNNVGVADYNGIKVAYGLCIGSLDLIGIVDGRFFALEIKAKGQLTEEQKDFIRLVLWMKGYACVVRSVEAALDAVEEARKF